MRTRAQEYFTMMIIHTLPAFNDNYLWLFHEQGSNDAYVVDPGDPAVVTAALKRHSLKLNGILITHHHADHTGGVESLVQDWQVPVYGPNSPHIPQVSHFFGDGETLTLSDSLALQAISVPGHTLDHIAWFTESDGQARLFCGDTLFAGGCGRMFEGDPAQMHHSLSKLGQLPGNTLVYCAHEYTLANLAFALAVEPENKALQTRWVDAQAIRKRAEPTVPTSIAVELETNPFLRCSEPTVKLAAEHESGQTLSSAWQVFGAVRQWKDSF